MTKTQTSGRFSWLNSALFMQRGKLAALLDRLKGFGAHTGCSFSLNRKFTLLLEQVECEKEKERDIIFEIEALEKQHQEMKRLKKLRRANAEKATIAIPDFIPANDEKKEDDNMPRLLWFFYLLSNSGFKSKNERVG